MSCDSGVSSAADTTSKGRCLKLFKKKHVMDNLQEVTVGAVGRPGPRQPGSLCHEGTPMETPRLPLHYPWLNLQCESRLAMFEICYQSTSYERASCSIGSYQSKNFCEAKNKISTVKRQPAGWRKCLRIGTISLWTV